MKALLSRSPLNILERSSRRGLGQGHLGVVIARAGAGKTACLIHIALDKIFRGQQWVHVSLEEAPDKVASYYEVTLHELLKASGLRDKDDAYRGRIDSGRMILAYLNRSFDLQRLQGNLQNIRENLGFKAEGLVIDGLDFEKAGRGFLEGLRDLARGFGVEVWLSARSHRHIPVINARGIPYPCHELADLFAIILQLEPQGETLQLRLLKDHDQYPASDISVSLDPKTFQVLDG